jgi:hypothetical protein
LVSDDVLRIRTVDSTIDALELLKAVDATSFDEAVTLYGGSFLCGFDISLSSEFELWCDSIAARVHNAAGIAHRQCFNHAMSVGNWLEASRLLDVLRGLNPEDPELRAEGARLAVICADGEAPSGGLERLPQRHVTNLLLSPGMRALRSATNRADRVPFVGRHSDFGIIARAWDASLNGAKQTVLVAGEAGIGKSRLCEHFLRGVGVRGGSILIARCSLTTQNVPYGAFIQLLKSGIALGGLQSERDRILGRLTQELKSVGPASISKDPLLAIGHELTERSLSLFEAIARLRPVAIWLKDMHWADECSMQQFQSFIESQSTDRILVLGTYIQHDLLGTPAACLHTACARDSCITRIDLAELSRADVWLLYDAFERRTGWEVPEAMRRILYEEIGGRPFYLIELLEQRRTEQSAQGAFSSMAVPLRIPARVHDLLAQRFAGLSLGARRILGVLAVAGHQLEMRLLSKIFATRVTRLTRAIDELVWFGFAQVAVDSVMLTHSLVARAALEILTPSQRARISLRVALALENDCDLAPSVMASLFDAANVASRAYNYHCRAAEQALRIDAFDEARRSIAGASATARDEDQRYRVLMLELDLLFSSRAFDAALPVGRSVRGWLESRGDRKGVLRCQAVELLADLTKGSRPAPDLLADAIALYRDANVEFSEVDLAEVICMITEAAYSCGNRSFLESFAPQLWVRARSMHDDGAAVMLLAVCATTYALYIDARAATAIAKEASDRSEKADSLAARIRAAAALGATLLAAGYVDRATDSLAAAIRLTEACGFRNVTRGLHNNYAVALMEQHRLNEAESLLRHVLAGNPSHGRLNAYGNLILCLLEGEKWDAAVAVADSMALENSIFASELGDSMVSLSRGTFAFEKNDLATACMHSERLSLVIDNPSCTINDRSYFDMFISRVERKTGRLDRSIGRLERGVVRSRSTNALAALRLEVELASALCTQDVDRALSLALAARSRAEELAASAILRKVDLAIRNMRAKASI